MAEQRYAIDFKDREGKRYVMTTKRFKEYQKKRWEFKEPWFPARIEKAVRDADPIYQSLNSRYCFCYYLYEFTDTRNNRKRYTKVVVHKDSKKKLYTILSAFRPDKIHESKFKKPCNRP